MVWAFLPFSFDFKNIYRKVLGIPLPFIHIPQMLTLHCVCLILPLSLCVCWGWGTHLFLRSLSTRSTHLYVPQISVYPPRTHLSIHPYIPVHPAMDLYKSVQFQSNCARLIITLPCLTVAARILKCLLICYFFLKAATRGDCQYCALASLFRNYRYS